MMQFPRSLAFASLIALAACGPQPAPVSTTPPTPVSPVTQAATMEAKLAFVVLDDKGVNGEKFGCDDSIVTMICMVPVRGTVVESALTALLDRTTDYTLAGNCRPVDEVSGVPSVSTLSTLPTSTMPTVSSIRSAPVTTLAYENTLASKNLTLVGVDVEMDDTVSSVSVSSIRSTISSPSSSTPSTLVSSFPSSISSLPVAADIDSVTVRLTGTPTVAGVCEPPRLTAQIESTVLANLSDDEDEQDDIDVVIELNGDAKNWKNLADGRGTSTVSSTPVPSRAVSSAPAARTAVPTPVPTRTPTPTPTVVPSSSVSSTPVPTAPASSSPAGDPVIPSTR